MDLDLGLDLMEPHAVLAYKCELLIARVRMCFYVIVVQLKNPSENAGSNL